MAAEIAAIDLDVAMSLSSPARPQSLPAHRELASHRPIRKCSGHSSLDIYSPQDQAARGLALHRARADRSRPGGAARRTRAVSGARDPQSDCSHQPGVGTSRGRQRRRAADSPGSARVASTSSSRKPPPASGPACTETASLALIRLLATEPIDFGVLLPALRSQPDRQRDPLSS